MISSPMPQAGPPRSVSLPTSHEEHLANGLRVVVFSRAEIPAGLRIPLVSASIMIERGSASDPPRRPGVAAMTSALLREGTKRRSAQALDLAVDALGARFDRSTSYDASSTGVNATSLVFGDALALLAETVLEPTFSSEEFQRVRTRALSDLRLSYSSPSSLARLVAGRAVGGDSPYGHPIAGTPRSLEALARDLEARGKIDLAECFIDGTFVVAKKGAPKWERPSGAKVASSWLLRTLLVFHSPCTRLLLLHMKSDLSKLPSMRPSPWDNPDDLLGIAPTTLIRSIADLLPEALS